MIILLAWLTAAATHPGERIVEIRVQGNVTTSQAEVERLANIRLGDPIEMDTVALVRQRLEDSAKFDQVEVLKRWRTIDPGEEVVLVILVREHPAGAGGLLGHLTRALGQPMILPIVNYDDGYGLTYGGRISPPEMLGAETHTSIPLTWGATRQAAIEVGRRFERGPLTYASATVAIRERENPHYKEDDTRRIVGARVERRLASWLLAGASSGWTDVSFATLDQRFVAWGADIAFDTRKSLELPRNAAYVQAGWEVLDFDAGPSVHRFRTDARGYVGLAGAAVLAVRVVRASMSEPAPPYEQFLLGGASSVRGFRAGYDAGESLLTGSVELRLPLTSPVSFGSAGASVFVDTGGVTGAGRRLRDATFRTGIGGGLFFSAAIFRLNLDVARGLDEGYRLHVSAGLHY
jgi:outer membrane protein assembly factor BamA